MPEDKNQLVDARGGDVFMNLLYQQLLDANAGNTTIMQALIGKVGKQAISGEADIEGALSSLKELMSVSKEMQLNTVSIMESIKKLND